MALADLLLGTDPKRERWLTTGASLIVIDTLVHNWMHRTGILRELGAEHAYGSARYQAEPQVAAEALLLSQDPCRPLTISGWTPGHAASRRSASPRSCRGGRCPARF